MLKKWGTSVLLLLVSFGAMAQLGKSRQEVIATLGQERLLKESEGKIGYKGLLFQLEETLFMQASLKADRAVMLSYMKTDSLLSEQQYKTYVDQNLPGFKPGKKCRLGNKTYLIDTQKNQMVLQTHKEEVADFPLIALILVTDPAMISGMSEKVTRFCK